jgi:hypothetical protein
MIGRTPILEIYKRYSVPRNLQLHMLRVTGVALVIAENWMGSTLDTRLLCRVLLLHDIGNIVKIDVEKLPHETWEENFTSIQETQAKMRHRFGSNDHLASAEIACEVGLTASEIDFLNAKIFIKNDLTLASHDYNLKIAAYADQRVAPTGVVGLLERLNEAKTRYRNKPGSSMNNPRTDHLIQCAIQIEKQIMQYCSLQPDEITDARTMSFTKKLEAFSI